MLAAAAAEPEPMRLRVRNATDGDMSFVLDTWRKSWRLADENRRLRGRVYHAAFDDLVEDGLLGQPDTRVTIACPEDDPGRVAAWMCWTPGTPTLHYAYVRRECRRGGLFGVLLSGMGVLPGGGLAYTLRPQEWAHQQSDRFCNVEQKLLSAARRHRVSAAYVDAERFLGRGKR